MIATLLALVTSRGFATLLALVTSRMATLLALVTSRGFARRGLVDIIDEDFLKAWPAKNAGTQLDHVGDDVASRSRASRCENVASETRTLRDFGGSSSRRQKSLLLRGEREATKTKEVLLKRTSKNTTINLVGSPDVLVVLRDLGASATMTKTKGARLS